MKKLAQRISAFLLTALVIVPLVLSPVSASAKSGSSSKTSTSIKDVNEILNALSYADYRAKYAGKAKATEAVTIDIFSYDTEKSIGVSTVDLTDDDKGEVLYVLESKDETTTVTDVTTQQTRQVTTSKTASVTWKFNVATSGKYALEITYRQGQDGKKNAIERTFYLNGESPFSEARTIVLSKMWQYDYKINGDGSKTFENDIRDKKTGEGNDIRPSVLEDSCWQTVLVKDSDGYYKDPFEFYIEAGENTITLDSARGDCYIASIRLVPYDEPMSYADYLTLHGNVQSNLGTGSLHIQAEAPDNVSAVTMYPVYDRTSPFTEGLTGEQSAQYTKYNTAGGEQWQNVGEWMEYQIDVPTSGYYKIAFRYKQDMLSGMYVSRAVSIDGEVPFAEANNCKFNYTDNWEVQYLGDGENEFEFYLTAGTHTIRFEAVLGQMGEKIQQVAQTLSNINSCYLEILKLTGSTPDTNRTYGFSRVMPEVLKTMMVESQNLQEIYDYLVEEVGKGEQTSTIEQVKILLKTMASDETQIPAKLSSLKSYIGSLGTWINNAKSQPLQVDYIVIQPENASLPKANANFFQKFWYEIKLFFYSFFTDYSSIGVDVEGASEGDSIEVWVASGRDQASIIRNLIDNNFTPQTNISTTLKLISAGTLLPSVLAGVGPDVSLMDSSTMIIDYALRNAIEPLNEYIERDLQGGVDVLAMYPEAAMVPITLYTVTTNGTETTEKEIYYGLPDSLSFSMLFYRKDVLASLDLEIPQTWDDMLAMIPVLQYNNMEIGIQNDMNLFIYQSGNTTYANYGKRINYDSVGVLNAFTKLCNMYTQYSLPVTYDFANRFRTGEMPIGIASYTMCNQLSVFASELSGLWGFVPLPGIESEDGTINNCAMATVTGCCMISNEKSGDIHYDSAWEFMKWYTGKEFQVQYSNEIVSIMGIAQRPATANIQAIKELPWTTEEANNILAQFGNLSAVPNYPGSYYLSRYVNFAFLSAYNEGKDPADALLSYVNTINKEITRKRKEFGMDTDNGETDDGKVGYSR